MLVYCMNLKKLERYLRVHFLGPGPPSYKKRIYRAAVSQRLRNTALEDFFAKGLKFRTRGLAYEGVLLYLGLNFLNLMTSY